MNTTMRIARVKKGMTQKDLASTVGITSKYMSSIERHNLQPSPRLMKKISTCLDVSVQDLFFQTDEQ